MTTNLENIRNGIRLLERDVEHLQAKLDGLDFDSLEAESVERILSVKEGLLSDETGRLERAEDLAVREAAEARWHHHEREGTLDLY